MKSQLRALLGQNSPEWRLLHGLRLRFERVRPPRLEPALPLQEWMDSGSPAPPPHVVKERIVTAYALAFGARALIETGTYAGDMVWAMRDRFDRIFSIELSERLASRAQRRFRAFPHIRILHGDSGSLLPDLLATLSCRCLFWLDSHYCAGVSAKGDTATPVVEEMKAILRHAVQDHVILVDDARLFGGTGGFPCVPELAGLVLSRRPGWDFSVRSDVIRIHPRQDVASGF